jgi:prolyl-tRNA editing enzyme YbaK/EbsC (Cys-tRNA(Pro) deacylase)
MASGLDRFIARAHDRGLEVTPTRFPEGTRTARDAARAIGCDVDQIVKSLVFVADDAPVLVLTSGANRVDEAGLAAHLGAEVVRKATAQEVRDATGYAIGGTPPFGHDTDLRVLCDADLTGHDEVWAAAGSADSVFGLSPDRLVEISGADVALVAERSA